MRLGQPLDLERRAFLDPPAPPGSAERGADGRRLLGSGGYLRMAARGERVITAGEREVQVLFTNRALAGAEKELGRGVFDVLQGFQNGGPLNDVVVLLRPGMEAARKDARVGVPPVRPGDALRLELTVDSVRVSSSRSDLGIVRWTWCLYNQRDEHVLELEATSLFDLATTPNV